MVKKLIQKLSEKVLGTKKKAEPERSPERSPEPSKRNQRRRPSGKRSGGKPDQKPQQDNETWEPGRPKEGKSEPRESREPRKQSRSQKPSEAREPRKPTKSREPRKQSESHDEPSEQLEQGKPWTLDDYQVEPKEGVARFHDFNLPIKLMHAVADLGFEYCTPIQSKVLTHAKCAEDIAGRAQTGTGKTAAFLMCVYGRFLANPDHRKGMKPGTPRALVIAPTRELVVQIVKDAQDLAKYCQFRSLAVYGGTEFEKQKKTLTGKHVDLVVATPGRLLDFVGRRVIDLKQVDVLVLDEADRMLDMGFIPDVRRIINATPPKQHRQTMLFSATLTEDVLRLSSQWMTDPIICEVDPEQVTVDTVEQIVYAVTARQKFALLKKILSDEKAKRVLIFGNRRDSTQRLSNKLKKAGITCEYLSGAVRQDKRQRVLEDFREGKLRVVVATDVAGRGLHIDDVTHVINYEFPYEPEDYVHRIGRTGRAGVKGTAISFACEEESFVIPEIEKYIGQRLPCVLVDPSDLD